MFSEFKWRAWKFKTLLKMSYVTNQKSLQAYSLYSLQSFIVLLWFPTLRKCSSLGLHVASLQNGFLFLPPVSSHKGTTAFFISPICSLWFWGLHKPLCQCLCFHWSLSIIWWFPISSLYSVKLQSSCRKSYCSCSLVCPRHHTGSAYRLQYWPLRKVVTPEQLSADQSQDSACKTITKDSN